MQSALVLLLLLAQCGVGAGAGAGAGFGFSGVFGDSMVLQRSSPKNPSARAAVYGGGAAAGSAVKVALSPTDAATLRLATSETFSTTAGEDGSWKVLLAPKPAGGSFTVTATSSGGEKAVLTDVTYGDVWFCSGQSNMELNMHFTFEKNDSYAAVAQDKYTNIRFFHLGHNPSPFKEMQWLTNQSIVTTNWTIADNSAVLNGGHGSQCAGRGSGDCTGLDQFSAACWYFAQKLTDRMITEAEAVGDDSAAAAAAAIVPLGMIESAYGGTTIEQWVSVEAQLRCTNVSCHANSSIPYSAATAEACTQVKKTPLLRCDAILC
jgi:sialate O-acetylesterase